MQVVQDNFINGFYLFWWSNPASSMGLFTLSKRDQSPGLCGSVWLGVILRSKGRWFSSSHGTCLGCRFSPWLGCTQRAMDQIFSLTSMFLFLFLPPLFRKINKMKCFKKIKRESSEELPPFGFAYVCIYYGPFAD